LTQFIEESKFKKPTKRETIVRQEDNGLFSDFDEYCDEKDIYKKRK